MAGNNLKTVWQSLTNGSFLNKTNYNDVNKSNTYNIDAELLRTTNKSEYEREKLERQQTNYLKNTFKKTAYDLNRHALNSENLVKMGYRDSDLMDGYPEISVALDLLSEEATVLNNEGNILNIKSNSDRVKAVLEDLFINKLNIHVNLPLWARTLCKYGNCYILNNIEPQKGIIDCRMLPVYEVDRNEGDFLRSKMMGIPSNYDKTTFSWIGNGASIDFEHWQVSHFRLLKDTILLPYGTSVLYSARQHWRRLIMAEDTWQINRLERAFDKRVFKIDVGAIASEDVEAYIDTIANTFKRKSIVDPKTGQLDYKMNIMDASEDYFIPVRNSSDATSITTLQGSSNMESSKDVEYFSKKMAVALRVPLPFLGYTEETGDGKNLALQDIRFARTITKIQQALLMELNKLAQIHLFMLGFEEDLNNFSLSLNNPSTQLETIRLEELQKKTNIAKDLLSDPGNGIQIKSFSSVLREVYHMSDKEIKKNLEEIRFEKALAEELKKTPQIIKRTGLFDAIDKIYGEPDADYQDKTEDGESGDLGSAIGGGGGGLSDTDFEMEEAGKEGDISLDDNVEIEGGEETTPPEEPSQETNENSFTKKTNKPLLNEEKLSNLKNIKTMINKVDKLML